MIEMKYIATIFFACAVLQTFFAKKILKFSHRFPPDSMQENLFHFLGEVEVVFGIWATLFITIWSIKSGTSSAAEYLSGVNFTEAVFVFVIMCMASTRPILRFSELVIMRLANLFPFRLGISLYLTCLILGPLLGSLITEPAAMTVTAILLRDKFFRSDSSLPFRYATLGLLFVNISIGGTFTHFAAPPVLMVAGPWNWDTAFMATHFGWRAAISIIVGTVATVLVFRKDLAKISDSLSREITKKIDKIPVWVTTVHLGFIALTIVNGHYISFFLPLFLLFLGWCKVATEFQDELRIKESLLVGFFLGGLVTLGQLQDWWLQPLISNLSETPLFWGALSLTAFTDNAAITYLGTLVPDLSAGAKYALVAGAVAGGGLTVIANAPNPAGYGILRDSFDADGISPFGLLLAALPYTMLAAAAFLL